MCRGVRTAGESDWKSEPKARRPRTILVFRGGNKDEAFLSLRGLTNALYLYGGGSVTGGWKEDLIYRLVSLRWPLVIFRIGHGIYETAPRRINGGPWYRTSGCIDATISSRILPLSIRHQFDRPLPATPSSHANTLYLHTYACTASVHRVFYRIALSHPVYRPALATFLPDCQIRLAFLSSFLFLSKKFSVRRIFDKQPCTVPFWILYVYVVVGPRSYQIRRNSESKLWVRLGLRFATVDCIFKCNCCLEKEKIIRSFILVYFVRLSPFEGCSNIPKDIFVRWIAKWM